MGRIQTWTMGVLLLACGIPALAARSSGRDHAAFGGNITVPEGTEAGDIACAFCSVRVQGDVTGDVAIFWGSIEVAPGRNIAGDVAVAAGDVRLSEGATVGGDLAVLGGDTELAEGVDIKGERIVLPRPLGTLILLSPLIVLALLIWLVVYLVRRNRYRFPAYPQGRGLG